MSQTAGETSLDIRVEIERPRNHHDADQAPEDAHAQALEPARELILRRLQNIGILDRFTKWLKPNMAHDLIQSGFGECRRPQQLLS